MNPWDPFDPKVTNAEALETGCPHCKRRKGNECVYTSDAVPPRWHRRQRWVDPAPPVTGPSRIGKPLANGNVHSERRAKIRRVRKAAWIKERNKHWTPPFTISESLLAVRRFDLAEYVLMQKFLRRWGPILWGHATVACPACGRAACDGDCEAERLLQAEKEWRAMKDEVTDADLRGEDDPRVPVDAPAADRDGDVLRDDTDSQEHP